MSYMIANYGNDLKITSTESSFNDIKIITELKSKNPVKIGEFINYTTKINYTQTSAVLMGDFYPVVVNDGKVVFIGTKIEKKLDDNNQTQIFQIPIITFGTNEIKLIINLNSVEYIHRGLFDDIILKDPVQTKVHDTPY